ncbi:hypothetical protein M3Y94_00163900 [Aphelenchoides besseyi]|nr:hypothetical protein M3Y94_00163900 [Aphelenchoides besseyi]
MLPTNSTDQLTRVPDAVLLRILSAFGSNDLLKLRLICRRFQRVIAANLSYLARPTVECLRCQTFVDTEESRRQIHVQLKRRNRPLRSSTTTVDSTTTALADQIESHLRSFVIEREIVIVSSTIDEQLIQTFLSPIADLRRVSRLTFEFCHFNIAPTLFSELVSRTSCSVLSIEFCKNISTIVNDELFAQIPQLDSLCLQVDSPFTHLDITDSSLQHWCTQKSLPTTLDLQNAHVGFTINGLIGLVQSLYFALTSSSLKSNSHFFWRLGQCRGTTSELLNQLRSSSIELQTPSVVLRFKRLHDGMIDVHLRLNEDCNNNSLNRLQRMVTNVSCDQLKRSSFSICFKLTC